MCSQSGRFVITPTRFFKFPVHKTTLFRFPQLNRDDSYRFHVGVKHFDSGRTGIARKYTCVPFVCRIRCGRRNNGERVTGRYFSIFFLFVFDIVNTCVHNVRTGGNEWRFVYRPERSQIVGRGGDGGGGVDTKVPSVTCLFFLFPTTARTDLERGAKKIKIKEKCISKPHYILRVLLGRVYPPPPPPAALHNCKLYCGRREQHVWRAKKRR